MYLVDLDVLEDLLVIVIGLSLHQGHIPIIGSRKSFECIVDLLCKVERCQVLLHLITAGSCRTVPLRHNVQVHIAGSFPFLDRSCQPLPAHRSELHEYCRHWEWFINLYVLNVLVPQVDMSDLLDLADKTEVEANTRVAKVLLDSFPDMKMRILPHILKDKKPNPEYEINGHVADRKGIMGEKGISEGFRRAKEQGCSAVVIDLDMHMSNKTLRSNYLAKYIDWRKTDFENDLIIECYVIYREKAVKINKSHNTRDKIFTEIEKLKP